MPFVIVLHERDTFSHKRMSDDYRRFPFQCMRMLDGLEKFFNVIAIAFEDMPVERFPFISERLKVHDLVCEIVNLAIISIDDSDEIVNVVMSCSHHGFTDLSLVELAVSMKAVDTIRLLVEAQTEGTPYRN